jgi:aerotolerance regulator-like protein
MPPVWAAWEWSRPFGLAALAIPVLVLLLARRSRTPPVVPTGTLELWRGAAQESASGAARASRWSWPLILCLASLCLGALALAGPRFDRREPPVWRIVVDQSPSMFLPWAAPGATTASGSEGAPTRIAKALATTLQLLDERAVPGDRRAWYRDTLDGPPPIRGTRPPDAWLRAPRTPQPDPPFERFDQPDTLWLTDRAPASPPLNAGVCASGGAPVPGSVSNAGGKGLAWDGAQLAESPVVLARELAIDERVPPELRRFLGLWAEGRSLALASAPGPNTVLEISVSANDPFERVRATRDGWHGVGEAASTGALVFFEDGRVARAWLTAEDSSKALVTVAPGRIDVAFRTFSSLDSDPASFAVSWSKLLDSALIPANGVVALAERLAAGEPLARAPRSDEESRAALSELDPSPTAWLATLCALLAMASLASSRLRIRRFS